MAELVERGGSSRNPPLGSTPAGAPDNRNALRRSTRRAAPAVSSRFVAAVEELDGGAALVSLLGEVDRATVLALEQTLLGVAQDLTGDVIVDLTGCSLLDSRGLGALVAGRARLERADRRLVLVLANQSVLRIFQITGFDVLFEIYPSLGAAVGRDADRNATTMSRSR